MYWLLSVFLNAQDQATLSLSLLLLSLSFFGPDFDNQRDIAFMSLLYNKQLRID